MRTDFRGLWLLAGAWLAALLQPPGWAVLALLGAFAGLFALLLRARHDAPHAAPWFTGPLVLLLGALAVLGTNLGAAECTLPEPGDQQRRITAHFEDPPRPADGGGVAGAALLTGYQHRGHWQRCPIPIHLALAAPLPGHAREFTVIASLQPAQDSGSFTWWARADSEPKVTSWQLPTPASNLKERFAAQLVGLPPNARALLPGMLYGDRSGQDQALGEAMKGSGLSHLTAVSGSNIALVGSMLMVLLRLFAVPRVLAGVLMAAGLGLFVAFVGPDPSVLRAGLMGAIAVFSLLSGRGQGSLGILGLSAAVLLLVDRSLAAEPAFALSVLATAGIIMLAPPLAELAARILPALLAEPTAICVAAQFTCLPVVIALNADFSLYSLPANLLAAPLLPVITALGVAALLLCTVIPGAAHVLAWLIGWPAEAIGQLAHLAVRLPGASRPWPEGLPGIVIAAGIAVLFCVLLIAGSQTERLRVRRTCLALLGVLAVFLAALVLPATLFWKPPLHDPWTIAMCDVGQGDALVVRDGESSGWLIDAGPPGGGVSGCLRQLGITTLSKVFMTHQDADHFGGVPELESSGVTLGERLVSAGFPEALWQPHRVLVPGDTGQGQGVSYRVIGPDPAMVPGAEPNDISLVLRLSFTRGDRQIDFLTAGDMEEQAMHRLLAASPQGNATILKASHHGARNGGQELIEAARPRVFLVSVGADNTYGHPNQGIIDTAQRLGAQVLRTDQLGTVLLTLDADGVHAASLGAPVR
ncbi:ComEC/Rec2 family competence protein [Glutamicibacter soli]|uniref:ComEC/Rec2 family competence protein n=1 Tax=Glutamicibacter soli TaxID=453836 RepID=UPI003C75DFC4